MTTQVPGTQDEAMPDAHTNGKDNGYDEDIIVGQDDLVIQIVSTNVLMQSLV